MCCVVLCVLCVVDECAGREVLAIGRLKGKTCERTLPWISCGALSYVFVCVCVLSVRGGWAMGSDRSLSLPGSFGDSRLCGCCGDRSLACLPRDSATQAAIGLNPRLPTYMYVCEKNQRIETGCIRHCAHRFIIASSLLGSGGQQPPFASVGGR